MPVQRVFIVRHGETDYNVEHRWQGHLDIPLNQNGQQQAQLLANYLQNEVIDAIFASDLKRAYSTAQAIARLKGLSVIADPRLREINVGIFQGMSNVQIEEAYPEDKIQWDINNDFAPANGESRYQVQTRAYEAWQSITNQADVNTALLVAHGGTIRMLLEKIFPERTERIQLHNTSVSIIDRARDMTWLPTALNITPHIS